MDICQLRLKDLLPRSPLLPVSSFPVDNTIARLSLSPQPACHPCLRPPCESHSQAVVLTLLADSQRAAAQVLFFACHLDCASLPLLASPTFGFQLPPLLSNPAAAYATSRTIFHSPYHDPLFSTWYILATSAFTLSSLLDLIFGRRFSKSYKSHPELCP